MRAAIVWEEACGVEEGWDECWGEKEVCYQGVGLRGYEGRAEDARGNMIQEGWGCLREGRIYWGAGVGEVGVCGCEGAGEVKN